MYHSNAFSWEVLLASDVEISAYGFRTNMYVYIYGPERKELPRDSKSLKHAYPGYEFQSCLLIQTDS